MSNQDIRELVEAVLSRMQLPWTPNITDRVCLAIEDNSAYLQRYQELAGIHGQHTVNRKIGEYTCEITGLHNSHKHVKAQSTLIKTYTKLD